MGQWKRRPFVVGTTLLRGAIHHLEVRRIHFHCSPHWKSASNRRHHLSKLSPLFRAASVNDACRTRLSAQVRFPRSRWASLYRSSHPHQIRLLRFRRQKAMRKSQQARHRFANTVRHSPLLWKVETGCSVCSTNKVHDERMPRQG